MSLLIPNPLWGCLKVARSFIGGIAIDVRIHSPVRDDRIKSSRNIRGLNLLVPRLWRDNRSRYIRVSLETK